MLKAVSVVALWAFGAVAPAAQLAAPQTTSPPETSCDQQCLAQVMDRFFAALQAEKTGSVPLSSDAEIRENARLVPLATTIWKDVKAVRSTMTFADPLAGNVVSRAGVELRDGRPGYVSTRLKVVGGGLVSDVELSADTSQQVVREYVWNLDPSFATVLPPEQRISRIALEALARRYFHSLSSHQATAQDFDAACNRFHSGLQVTNTAVFGQPPKSCAEALEGNPPWGPATEQRFPVIDPERGIVLGITLLHYPTLPDQPQMYVSELFKVAGGRIVKIDNIGLMTKGVTTIGFTH